MKPIKAAFLKEVTIMTKKEQISYLVSGGFKVSKETSSMIVFARRRGGEQIVIQKEVKQQA